MNSNLERVSLDTSVLLRLLVGVPEDQAAIARDFFLEQMAAGTMVEISDLVLSEAYFALQSSYRIEKKDANAMSVLSIPNLASAKPGFVDRLIHGASREKGHAWVTFEKAGKKLPGTVVLGGK
jgi:predicted nucleic acid-binding protein